MDLRKALLGLIFALALGSAFLVFQNTGKWPFEFKRGLDIQGGMHLVLQAKTTEKVKTITPAVMQSAIAVVRNRVDGLGVAEPLIQPKGDDQLIVDMPGIRDKDEALRVIGTTAVLSFRARKEDFPQGVAAPDATASAEGSASGAANRAAAENSATGIARALAEAMASAGQQSPSRVNWVLTGLEGTMITSARVEPQGEGSWAVAVEMNREGTLKLADLSLKLLQKPLAIFLDNKLVSAPIVQGEMPTGNMQITGNFTAQEAHELEVVLKAGSLPVPLEVIENRTVDASLGAESVQRSLLAGIIGVVAVFVFMAVAYRVPGLIANAALVIYILMNLAVFKLIPVTLTVPGIAGFILSIGMAVDANILIFERTREELQNGRTLYAAIENGFKRAFSAIFDSNMNTILSMAVLFYFGTGMVRGFALTLAIGVLISMFTAITATRTLLHYILEARQLRTPTLFGVEVKSRIR